MYQGKSRSIYKDKNNNKFKNKLVKAFRNIHPYFYPYISISFTEESRSLKILSYLHFLQIGYNTFTNEKALK